MRRTVLCVSAFSIIFLVASANAQPLVTGNLTLYYDFDEIVVDADGNKQFLDESGNDFAATIFEGDLELDAEPGTLSVSNDNPLRGAGAANFAQSPLGEDLPVYLDLDGQNITENFPELLPTGGLNDIFGVTIAAWVNVRANDVGDQSVLQGRTSDGGHGAPHFQLQGDGKLRMTFRNQASGTVVNAPTVFIDGTQDSGERYPIDEWFHYAGTYDVDENLWAMYYNGSLLQEGDGTSEDLGDWGGVEGDFFGAGIGAVYDSGGRRFDGLMDEFYVFNRALTAEEINTLASPPAPVVPGDCNDDGVVDSGDLACVSSVEERDVILQALGTLPGDLDGDGSVAFADFLILSDNFGEEGLGYADGNIDLMDTIAFADFLVLSDNFGKTAAASAVPEPSSLVLASFIFSLIGLVRASRKRTI